MRWKSPWGDGFPGWHIECSAMSSKYLGDSLTYMAVVWTFNFHIMNVRLHRVPYAIMLRLLSYWLHNNMITINGRKMGKSYNNVIKLSELFSGNHPILEQAYSPMTIRFFILQTHYRSTLDFGNEALQGSERGLKRLWEAYEQLGKLAEGNNQLAADKELDEKVKKLLSEFDEFMDDDLNTAKVLANMFELAPIINGIKDKHIGPDAISAETLGLLKSKMKVYLEDIFGLKMEKAGGDKLEGVVELLINIRKEARSKKDFVTSDKIRNELQVLGIQLKDEKDGNMSFSIE
jgi:cysteinyl-tRNA synthetase